MRELPVRGVIAPALCGVSITFAIANLVLPKHPLTLAIVFPLILMAPFVRDTHRLLLDTFTDD